MVLVCYLLNDFSAFIFHLNVHLLSSTFWNRLIYIIISKKKNEMCNMNYKYNGI